MELDKTIINECIEKNMDEAVQTLKSLISINSVGGDPVTVRTPGTSNQGQAPIGGTSEQGQAPFGGAAPAESKVEVYPFGRGVQDVFECVLAKGGELGFDTCDVDHYGGHIEWKGVKPADEAEAVGIIIEVLDRRASEPVERHARLHDFQKRLLLRTGEHELQLIAPERHLVGHFGSPFRSCWPKDKLRTVNEP